MKRNIIILFLVSVLIFSILLGTSDVARAEEQLAHLHRQKRKESKPHQDWMPYGWSLEARTRGACIARIKIMYPIEQAGSGYFVYWKYEPSPD
jgi:hypothetical protein